MQRCVRAAFEVVGRVKKGKIMRIGGLSSRVMTLCLGLLLGACGEHHEPTSSPGGDGGPPLECIDFRVVHQRSAFPWIVPHGEGHSVSSSMLPSPAGGSHFR